MFVIIYPYDYKHDYFEGSLRTYSLVIEYIVRIKIKVRVRNRVFWCNQSEVEYCCCCLQVNSYKYLAETVICCSTLESHVHMPLVSPPAVPLSLNRIQSQPGALFADRNASSPPPTKQQQTHKHCELIIFSHLQTAKETMFDSKTICRPN